MTIQRSQEYLIALVKELLKYPKETEWLEFKLNKKDPEEIGEYISALSNSAAILGKTNAYLIWGIEDSSHTIVGTKFSPPTEKVGNEELESWLLRFLNPKINFRFWEILVDGKKVVVLEIEKAFRHPVQFKAQEFIRIGSYKKKLKDFREKERELWRLLDNIPFEKRIAADNLKEEEILQFIDYPTYFDLTKQPLPDARITILKSLQADDMISRTDAGTWGITNLGAILFAKKIENFSALKRKSIRIIQYSGNNKLDTIKEQESSKGYASDFEFLVSYINNLIPVNEVIEKATRKTVPLYPMLALRELLANAIIHQDFFVNGTGALVEVFKNRIEITNPGKPLVDTQRFLDSPPRSRNEILASFMRRIGFCEERGSGIDKVVYQTEIYQLPAPIFETSADNTHIILFAPRSLNTMEKVDKIRACYLHSCLKYVLHEKMTNASLRERFGIEERNSATVSRIIKDALDANMIKIYDSNSSKKFIRYIPFWA